MKKMLQRPFSSEDALSPIMSLHVGSSQWSLATSAISVKSLRQKLVELVVHWKASPPLLFTEICHDGQDATALLQYL